MATEKDAKYRITQEPDWRGILKFHVYERRQRFQSGLLFGKYVDEWKRIDDFETLEKAEKYIRDAIAYREAKDNPKVVGYY